MNKKIVYQSAILIVLYIGYGFYFFTRKSFIFMLPYFHINETSTFNLTKNQIGIVISGQNFAYAFSKLIAGVLTDIFSCRILFGSGLFLSGLLNIYFKKDIQIASVYKYSCLIGFVQGPAWPCCAKLLQNWLPKSQFAIWWSILSTSSNVAGTVGPVIATSIALNYHWSYVFLISGCICMTFAYLSLIILRNKPSDVGLGDLVSKTIYPDQAYQKISVIIKSKQLFSYPFFISICLCFFTVQLIKTLFTDWAHIYMIKSLKISKYDATYFLSIFELSGIFGSLVSGFVSDFLSNFKFKFFDEKKRPCSAFIRMIVNIIFFVGILISLHLFNFYLDSNMSQNNLLMIGALSGFFCFGCISLLGVIAIEFTPKYLSGTSHAYACLAANLGSISAGLPFGYTSKLYSWSFGFKLTEVFASVILISLILCIFTKSKFEPLLSNCDKKSL